MAGNEEKGGGGATKDEELGKHFFYKAVFVHKYQVYLLTIG